MKGRWKKNKKKIYSLVCICMMLLLLPLSVAAARAEDSEFRLHYPYEGVLFRLYKIASFEEGVGYELEDPFTEYEDTVEGLDRLGELEAEEWRTLAYTLEHLVGTENIVPVKTMVTDQNGYILWEDIPKGLYLILGEEIEKDNMIYTPSPILVNVPNYDEKGDWNYQVQVNHNKIETEEKEEFIDIPIIKIWLDDCNKYNKRPDSIKVSLYKDGKLYDVVELSIENNWRYRWRDLPADAQWYIKELDVPDGYKTHYSLGGNKIAVVNKYVPEWPDKPDEPTTEEPDEPTTEEPDEPTTENPDGPTTEKPDEPTTEEQDGPTAEKPDESTTEEPDEPTTEEPDKPEQPKDEIPQTGQLWWPIPVLVIVGLVLFVLGWTRRIGEEER